MDCSPALPNSGQWRGICFFQLAGRRLIFQLLSGLAGIRWNCWEVTVGSEQNGHKSNSTSIHLASTPFDHKAKKTETSTPCLQNIWFTHAKALFSGRPCCPAAEIGVCKWSLADSSCRVCLTAETHLASGHAFSRAACTWCLSKMEGALTCLAQWIEC